MEGQDFVRLVNNFYTSSGIDADYNRIAIDAQLSNYIASQTGQLEKKYKVALLCISLNQLYWQFAKPMIEGVKQFFLPGHKVDVLFWSDMPEPHDTKFWQDFIKVHKEAGTQADQIPKLIVEGKQYLADVRSLSTIIPMDSMEWPLPTLFRYALFLQQEEKLKEYDYIFYCDIDMRFVGVVGDEILGDLTAAQHPMYAVRKQYVPPYEPNKESTAFIPRPGMVIDDGGKPRFMPMYYAGGFQGGKTDKFIEAMKVMKKNIDKDFTKNYIAIWNDESHWNKYLFDNPPSITLTPSYIYPDSLIKEYYEPLWGCSYPPKLMTLTKKFSTTPQGGEAVNKMIQEMKGLQK